MRTVTDVKRIAHELPKLNCLRKLEKDYGALTELAECVTMRRFEREQYVFKEGEVGTAFFILYQGAVMITANSAERKAEVLLKRLNKVGGHMAGRALVG
jgi:hypothetical protein